MESLKIALKKEPSLLSCMDAFANTASNHDDVATAGEQFLLKLYGAEQFATLDKYRHVAYKWSVARTSTSNSFTLASLPPTGSVPLRPAVLRFIPEPPGSPIPVHGPGCTG